MTQDDRSPLLGCAAVLVASVLLLWLAGGHYAWKFEKSRIPSRLTVERKLFSEEKIWGLGPGGNETRLIVYELSISDAARLMQFGNSLDSDEKIRSAMGRAEPDYYEWGRTPIPAFDRNDDAQQKQHPTLESYNARIADFLDRYGFHIETDPSIERSVDELISAPGSFHAAGRGGSLIIVSPARKRLVFAYAG
ncbi:hypothetical protein [Sphingomonas sp. TZW2008]|uniref:hypothetical protein n=1 Tax=Sphingomonas sp. TZW2008 TaxID=1917973 RepID=UPI001181B3EF|nr:hypothetical protein [Sphingomonas sp. TZW2008]